VATRKSVSMAKRNVSKLACSFRLCPRTTCAEQGKGLGFGV
jgi:hypothetical protein